MHLGIVEKAAVNIWVRKRFELIGINTNFHKLIFNRDLNILPLQYVLFLPQLGRPSNNICRPTWIRSLWNVQLFFSNILRLNYVHTEYNIIIV